MKYLSVVLFAVALIWTWNLIHQQSPVSFETHAAIQERMSTLIKETVQTKRPNASEITVEKVWTELVGSGRVKAFFIYSFKDKTDDGSTASQIRGEGLLERQPDDGSGNDRWALVKVRTNSDAVIFDDALVITPDTDADNEAKPDTQ